MGADGPKRLACAIYTRKSSEEGLDQSFNSLEAQREACESYIASQRHEGWRLLEARYDDGGFSGGTMDRPGLRQLLEDIRRRKVDVVVVYKVDRLTRALSDFAKIVEIFDAHGVSFVSVTQQFSTTTSMGRLTLNVLLSFAQFEREVTGERIRDKFAASRRKGMWMGGPVPLGYDLKDRKLLINQVEAEAVRLIFKLYTQHRCVRQLKTALDERGILSKRYVSETGRTWGGRPLSRGQLYYILRSRLYIGEAVHKDRSYPGEHEPIIDQPLWAEVQATLDANRYERRAGLKHTESSLLAGLLFDEDGNRFSPSHTQRHGRRYRYYVSQVALQHGAASCGRLLRMPAYETENLVLSKVLESLRDPSAWLKHLDLPDAEQQQLVSAMKAKARHWSQLDRRRQHQLIRAVVTKVVAKPDGITIALRAVALQSALMVTNATPSLKAGVQIDEPTFQIYVPAVLKRHGCETKLVTSSAETSAKSEPALIKLIVRAFDWYERFGQGQSTERIAVDDGVDRSYVARVLPLAFLAPDIVEAILDGRQPEHVNPSVLLKDLPISWAVQRQHVGATARSR